ncbi:MAG: ABC transporter substrate-binding protein [Eubacteriaceae bacterium]|jgi:iron complex transport system substrate-binding protein|nr:ABC transporter substrate-binding protein [Eubacteriaceae bacterium]
MKRKGILLLTFFLVLTVLLTACGTQNGKNDKAKDTAGVVELTDMLGRSVTMEKPAEKIVAVNPSACEILYAIGAQDTLIARGTYCDYPEEVQALPEVESGNNLNTEQIIALGPDLVIMSTMAQSEEQIQALETAGIQVIVADAHNLEGVYQSIELIGKAVAKEDKAAEVVDDMKAAFKEYGEKAKDEGLKVYFEISPLEHGLWSAGKNTFMDEIASILKLENIFSDVDGWSQVSEEQVLQRDPDIIVSVEMYMGTGEKPEDKLKERPSWKNLKAVENDRVYRLNNDAFTRPGPRLKDALIELYAVVNE